MTVTKKVEVPAERYLVRADSRTGEVTIYDKKGHTLIFENEARLEDYVGYLSGITSRKGKDHTYAPLQGTEGVRGSATVSDTEIISLMNVLRKAQDVVRHIVLEEVL